MVLNDLESLDQSKIAFNVDFIKSHGIKSIWGNVSIKKPNAVIRSTPYKQAYFFDSLGRISYSLETQSSSDTLWRHYFYNGKGQLIYQSFGTKTKFSYFTYQFDEKGRLVGFEEFFRQDDYRGIPITKQVKKEVYEHQECDSTCIKIISNALGTPFMKEESFFLLNGRTERVERRYLATNEGSIQFRKYNATGKLVENKTLTSKQKLLKESYEYAYDELGNVKEKKYYEEGILQSETQIIVNEETGLLSAILRQDQSNSILTIVRFQAYEYY